MDNNTIELTRTKTGSDKIVLVVGNGFTAAQVLAMLNSGQALLRSTEVLQRGSGMSEGHTVLAKVTSNRSTLDEGQWASVSEPEADTEADKKADCAGGCCTVLTPEERNRNFADSMRHKCNELAAAGNLSAARSMLEAAGALLDLNGGRENESGLWLLASEADIFSREDKHAEAEVLLNTALLLSIALNGEAHPCTGVCYINVAESLGDQGRYADALPDLEKGLAILEAATPVDLYKAEYIDNICTHARQLKAKFSHTEMSS